MNSSRRVPSANALVVRAGSIRDSDVLGKKVTDGVERKHLPAALSVWARDPLPGESRLNTLARIVDEAQAPHPKIQVSVHQTLIDAGFELVLDTTDGQAECHYNVFLRYPVETDQLRSFIDCFSEPEVKPETGGTP